MKFILGLVELKSDYTVICVSVSSKKFFDIQATIKCRFTMNCVQDLVLTCSQIFYCLKWQLSRKKHLAYSVPWI